MGFTGVPIYAGLSSLQATLLQEARCGEKEGHSTLLDDKPKDYSYKTSLGVNILFVKNTQKMVKCSEKTCLHFYFQFNKLLVLMLLDFRF